MSRFDRFPKQKKEAMDFNAGRSPNYPPDKGLLPYLRTINQNPNVAVFSSCSGHDGHPYIWVFFKTLDAERRYIAALRTAGLNVHGMGSPPEYNEGVYVEIPGTVTARAIKSGRGGTTISKTAAWKFWDVVTQILSHQ